MGTKALEDLVEDYLAHCLSEGRKRNTVENAYGYLFRQVFLPWCEEAAITQPSELTRRVVERYQGKLLTEGVPAARWLRRPSTPTCGWSTRC